MRNTIAKKAKIDPVFLMLNIKQNVTNIDHVESHKLSCNFTTFVATCWVSGVGGFLSGGAFARGDFCLGGLCPFPPSSMHIRTV